MNDLDLNFRKAMQLDCVVQPIRDPAWKKIRQRYQVQNSNYVLNSRFVNKFGGHSRKLNS